MSSPGNEIAQRVDAAPAIRYTHIDRLVDDVTVERLVASIPENTRRAYGFVYDAFDTWCAETGRVNLPATAETFTSYVSQMITAKAAPAKISQHMGAIRKRHKIHGFDGQPNSEAALQLLRGYRRERAADGEADREAAPLMQPELYRIIATLDPDSITGKRDHLLLVLGFAMMARRSELAALMLADVIETSDGLDITVRTSKTDKDSRGAVVSIPHGEHPELDAVSLVHEWRDLLTSRGIVDGPLLRAVDKHGHARGALKPDTVNAIVQDLVRRAKLPNPERYSAHSLRAGGLTAALRAGIPLGVAARHGRWSPSSPVVIRYARAADRWRDNAMRGVL